MHHHTYIHIIREMMAQGHIVVCPEYRGSTGYGKSFYEAIDYGGLENEDVLTARDYAVENYSVSCHFSKMLALQNMPNLPRVCMKQGIWTSSAMPFYLSLAFRR